MFRQKFPTTPTYLETELFSIHRVCKTDGPGAWMLWDTSANIPKNFYYASKKNAIKKARKIIAINKGEI